MQDIESLSTAQKAFKWAICVVLMVGAGLCSGLNLGMLSLDKVRLQALVTTGTASEQSSARKLLPLLEDRHLLIAVILLGNAMCTEILPELMDELLGEMLTIVLCVSVIVVCCEVVPQALMIKDGLKLCAKLSWFVWTLIYCSFIITFPLARLLDCVLGKTHTDYFSNAELKEFMMLHADHMNKSKSHEPKLDEQKQEIDIFEKQPLLPVVRSVRKASFYSCQPQISEGENSQNHVLSYDEISIIQGIFAIHQKEVKSIMKPLDDVYMLDFSTMLTHEVNAEIYGLGYSRIPVFYKNRQNIMGVLLTKQLIKYDPDETIPLSQLEISPNLPLIPETSSLAKALKEFEKGTAHIAGVVSARDFRVIGIVTLEDVLEQLLQEQIYDESDVRRAHKAVGKNPK